MSDDPKDKLPTDEEWDRIARRRKRTYFPQKEVITIVALLIALIAVLGMRKGCAQGVGNMFRAFEIDAGPRRAPGPPATTAP